MIKSFISFGEKDLNSFFNFIHLFVRGFIATYLSSFIFAMYALLLLSLIDVRITSSFSLYRINETWGLFTSKSLFVLWEEIYLLAYGFSLDILSK